MCAKRIEPDRAKELLDGGAYRFLDVRTPEEFREGTVPGARNVPLLVPGPRGAGIFPNPDFLTEVESTFEKTDRIVVVCEKGGRSTTAAGMMVDQGFRQTIEMRGGLIGETDPFGRVTFAGWTTRGFPIVRDGTM